MDPPRYRRLDSYLFSCPPACAGAVCLGECPCMVHTLRSLAGWLLEFLPPPLRCLFLPAIPVFQGREGLWKAFGRLVPLGFAIAGFTPAAYLRRSLRRPSILEILSWGGLRA